MKDFTIEIYAVDYCGFAETYQVQAASDTEAEDIAIEKYEQEFVDQMDLVPVDNGDGGYVESCDYDEWEEDPDSVETTIISTRVIY